MTFELGDKVYYRDSELVMTVIGEPERNGDGTVTLVIQHSPFTACVNATDCVLVKKGNKP